MIFLCFVLNAKDIEVAWERGVKRDFSVRVFAAAYGWVSLESHILLFLGI